MHFSTEVFRSWLSCMKKVKNRLEGKEAPPFSPDGWRLLCPINQYLGVALFKAHVAGGGAQANIKSRVQ